MSGKLDKADDKAEQPALRRSSRATRGSVKPIVKLTKEEENSDGEEIDEEEVEEIKPNRKSLARATSAKKSATKRGSNKKVVPKQSSSEDKNPKVKEENDEVEKIDAKVDTEPTQGVDEGGDEDGDDVIYELNEKEMKEINNAFDMNRLSDEEELLNADGLRTAMRSLGFEPRGDEIKRLTKKFAAKKSGKLTRDGFHKIMAFKYSTTPTMGSDRSNDEISRVFNLFDLDKTGLITFENLKSISKELNEELNEDDLHEMMTEADHDGDWKINKDEFYNIMKKTSLY